MGRNCLLLAYGYSVRIVYETLTVLHDFSIVDVSNSCNVLSILIFCSRCMRTVFFLKLIHYLFLSYMKVHIEQGPVLESVGIPLAVVKGIAGQTRIKVCL